MFMTFDLDAFLELHQAIAFSSEAAAHAYARTMGEVVMLGDFDAEDNGLYYVLPFERAMALHAGGYEFAPT